MGYTISGTVINAANGEPVRRATVSVQVEADRQTVASVETDNNGHFSLNGLAAGKYPLTASKRGFLTSFYDQHENFNTAIVTGVDQDTSGLIFKLTPGASLHGVVTGDGGDPVESAIVMLFVKPKHHNPGDRIRQAGTTGTDDTGAYEFDGLASGEYLVAAKAEPWYALHPASNTPKRPSSADSTSALDVAYPVTFFDSTTDEASASAIPLTGGSREEVNINLRTLQALRLTVESPINQNGASVAPVLRQTIFGMTVNNIGTGDPVTHNGTDEFELIGVAPGHYELTQGDPPRVAELDATTSQQFDPNLGSPTMALAGSLRTADGTALPQNLSVFLTSSDETQNHAPLQTISNGGLFSFAAVPPGSWELWTFANGKDPIVTLIAIGGRTRAGNQLTVHDQPLKVVVTVSLSEARVEGFARNKDGKGQPGVMVVLVPREPSAFDSLVRRDQSDSDGSFSLRDVAPGEYTVVAIAEGWELDWARPEVIGRYLSGGVAVSVTESSGKRVELTRAVTVQSR